jgi:hypothetical protein
MKVLSTLWRALGGARNDTPPNLARVMALETHVKALYDLGKENARELQQLRQSEALRAAEHATMVDQLSRLYKRQAARIARAEGNGKALPEPAEESVMDFRRRLGR